jgi:hypothetical protein
MILIHVSTNDTLRYPVYENQKDTSIAMLLTDSGFHQNTFFRRSKTTTMVDIRQLRYVPKGHLSGVTTNTMTPANKILNIVSAIFYVKALRKEYNPVISL